MGNNRRYERYEINEEVTAQIEATVEGEPAYLVNFSMGGLYFHSRIKYHEGDTVKILVTLSNKGMINVCGKVVRIVPTEEKTLWGIAVDLTMNFK
jgi:Tfp pilus assembly protein PilZ